MILQMLDVLIGLTLVYLILSTAASIGAELLESWLRERGRLLERGISQILAQTIEASVDAAGNNRDDAAQELVAILYNSPFIYSLYEGNYQPGGRSLPSAIPAARFAGALIALSEQEPRFLAVANNMLKVAGLELKADEHGKLIRELGLDEPIRKALAQYFDESMERVSGWYKRHVRLVLLAIGASFAVLLNVDTLSIVRSLSQDDALRAQVVEAAIGIQQQPGAVAGSGGEPICKDMNAAICREQLGRQLALVQSLGLPLGWNAPGLPACVPQGGPSCSKGETLVAGLLFVVSKIAGLLLTALATTLGAPFWFDLLKRLVDTRRVIAPKSGDEPAPPAAMPAMVVAPLSAAALPAPAAAPTPTPVEAPTEPSAANDEGSPDPGPTPPRSPRTPRRRRSTPRPPRNPTPAA